MDFSTLSRRFTLELPAWIEDEIASVPATLPTRADRMALVHRLATRNFQEGNGGPFAAIVTETDTGNVVSVGVNVVLASGISLAHAEVMALGLAQSRVGTWDLGAQAAPHRELVVNWRPCAQCYGATLWSGVTSLVVAGEGPELEQITGFDEGPMREDWAEQFEARGISIVRDVLRDEALATFEAYAEHVTRSGVLVYNARGAVT